MDHVRFWECFATAVERATFTPELSEAIGDLESEDASRICALLLGAATAYVDEGRRRADGIPCDVGDFVERLVWRSVFVDRLVDATRLSRAGRRLKWRSEDNAFAQSCVQQQHLRAEQMGTSVQNLRCLRRNAKAYRSLARRARHTDVLGMQLEMLRMQPPTFWAALQLEARPQLHQRAVLHKMQLFTQRFGGTAVPAATRAALLDLFARIAREESTKPLRRRRWWQPRMVRRLQKSVNLVRIVEKTS